MEFSLYFDPELSGSELNIKVGGVIVYKEDIKQCENCQGWMSIDGPWKNYVGYQVCPKCYKYLYIERAPVKKEFELNFTPGKWETKEGDNIIYVPIPHKKGEYIEVSIYNFFTQYKTDVKIMSNSNTMLKYLCQDCLNTIKYNRYQYQLELRSKLTFIKNLLNLDINITRLNLIEEKSNIKLLQKIIDRIDGV